MTQRQPRQRDEAHLNFVRSLPCLICLDDTSTEAAHIRYAEPRAGKRWVGGQEKPDDAFAVPLCGKHHREQHTRREVEWWQWQGIDPIKVSLALFRVSGDHERGAQIVAANGSPQ